ncbi:hypothetical protein [Prochlorococcus sp. MIT 0604]|uniref:hypothetical protein n=1 Tax=Prochlorococcus sp. MIT 0604 TaxID=1501268 RepID=UPI0004F85184|nr:hypothetical protein [Prochlorococcus sp. MIT 0604]AIQ94188.1 hypothetical protein EW14_0162 [Prochlorococcus sp. MIT 0604]
MTIKVNIENGVLEQKLNKAITEIPKSKRPNPFNETTAKRRFIELAIENYIKINYSGLTIIEQAEREVAAQWEAMLRRSAVT